MHHELLRVYIGLFYITQQGMQVAVPPTHCAAVCEECVLPQSCDSVPQACEVLPQQPSGDDVSPACECLPHSCDGLPPVRHPVEAREDCSDKNHKETEADSTDTTVCTNNQTEEQTEES